MITMSLLTGRKKDIDRKENYINYLMSLAFINAIGGVISMLIKDVQPNQGNVDLVLTVKEKGDVRTFEKFGRSGRVCTLTATDESGEIKVTLWNDDVDKVNACDKIHIKNGWCSEFKGEKQVSTGKFGALEVLEQATAAETPSGEPSASDTAPADEESPMEGSDESGDGEEPLSEEEIVE
jgi:replication factor A1